jgi:polysaccharide pyruvyl transferase WcaK-like protein
MTSPGLADRASRLQFGIEHRLRSAGVIWSQRKAEAPVAYIGWVGEGNLGDDLIYEIHKQTLQMLLLPMPLYHTHFGLQAAKLGRYLPEYPVVLLGGGTTIGRNEAKYILEALDEKLSSSTRFVMSGMGVEDPDFVGMRSYVTRDSIRAWRTLLSRFDEVLVRGPRSLELLADEGIPARIIGDPVLMYNPVAPPSVEGHIAVNLCNPEDSWGGSLAASHAAVVTVIKELVARGWKANFVAMADSDILPCQAAASQVGNAATVIRASTYDAFLGAVGGSYVFVGERLHSLVCAASMGIPSIGIEYRPKVRDFQQSIGMGSYSLRSDEVSRDSLQDKLDGLITARAETTVTMENCVGELRAKLMAQQENIRSDFDSATR